MDYADLLACYRSGQMSEAQRTAHMADPEFAALFRTAKPRGRELAYENGEVCGAEREAMLRERN